MSSCIEVQFADDGIWRIVAKPPDYVYPHDVRISADKRTLWVVARGLGAGIFPEAWLYEYDLAGRRIVREIETDFDDVPAGCAERKTPMLQQQKLHGPEPWC